MTARILKLHEQQMPGRKGGGIVVIDPAHVTAVIKGDVENSSLVSVFGLQWFVLEGEPLDVARAIFGGHLHDARAVQLAAGDAEGIGQVEPGADR